MSVFETPTRRYVDLEIRNDLCDLHHRLEGLSLAVEGTRALMVGDLFVEALLRIVVDCVESVQEIQQRCDPHQEEDEEDGADSDSDAYNDLLREAGLTDEGLRSLMETCGANPESDDRRMSFLRKEIDDKKRMLRLIRRRSKADTTDTE